MNNARNDPRLMFRALMGALLAAGSYSVTVAWPGTPPELVGLWGGVFLALVGVGEVWFDRKTTAVPNNATATEVKEILAAKETLKEA